MRPQIVKQISLLLMHFFVCAVALGQQVPPPPQRTGGPNPPGLPLDENILLLVVVGLILGVAFFLFRKSKPTN